MESPGGGFDVSGTNFCPYFLIKIEDPEIIEIKMTFSSENYQIIVDKFSCVVSSFCRNFRLFYWFHLGPFFTLPIQRINPVIP